MNGRIFTDFNTFISYNCVSLHTKTLDSIVYELQEK